MLHCRIRNPKKIIVRSKFWREELFAAKSKAQQKNLSNNRLSLPIYYRLPDTRRLRDLSTFVPMKMTEELSRSRHDDHPG